MPTTPNIGIDFGTTNSTIAVATGSTVNIAAFSFFGAPVDTFRSVLFFEHAAHGQPTPAPLAGPRAIERYLEPHEGGRLIQSLKSFAASSVFRQTQIGGRQFTLEDLIGTLLRILRNAVEQQLGPLGNRAVVGRPVRFVGAATAEDETRALARLRNAYALAGFDDIVFEYEPIGAAFSYAQRLPRRELVLIADFGGGTSDFSVIWLTPGSHHHEILATGGVPIGGDTFDARIIRRLVSPILGAGTNYRSVHKTLPVPESLYRKLESWHHLSFLRSGENLRTLQSIRAQAYEPEKIDRFLEIVEGDLGYHLHQSVMKTKVALSASEQADFVFTDTSTDIRRSVRRSEFEAWIAADLKQIESCVRRVLSEAAIAPQQIDRVFLTGGSSLLPALRRSFAAIFGLAKVASGDEFTSVARGLALVPRK
ncbi:MAG TPA: Hsp70 family protein [Bryobacteraceae bacterium]|nr:Hsp70 family protein [Bryobacteraceae bacterium]